MILRDYQQKGVELAEEALAKPRGSRRCFSAPTGSGKSAVELALLRPGRYLVTPIIEIVADMLRKLGEQPPESDEGIAEAGQDAGIWTPIRLRNKLVRGDVSQPEAIILDEAHHALADSWEEIDALCGSPPTVGFTATPYRGTARGTLRFRERWGEPVQLISLAECVSRGYVSLPVCSVKPLFDDDLITVKDGEFNVESANAVIGSRISDACDFIGGFFPLDRPTIVSLPSTECVHLFAERLGERACCITAETSRADRETAFADCMSLRRVLLQIKVVGEGVDLKLGRLIDLRPTLSPVAWLQQLGRIMRPGVSAEYVSCCRNLLRHAYLLEGLVPPATVAQATKIMGAGNRAAYRAIGLEAVGRFRPGEVHFADGNVGQIFAVSTTSAGRVIQYSIIAHPCYPEPITVRREYTSGNPSGKWVACDVPDLTGFASVSAGALTEKQLAWWKRDARRYGLDPDAQPTKKEFQALPILCHLKARFP